MRHPKVNAIRKFFVGGLVALFFVTTAFAYLVKPESETPAPLLLLPVPERTHVAAKKLTLRDAVLLALRTNPNVRSAEIQRVADKFALEVAHNAFEPQFNLTASALWEPGSRPQYSFSPGVNLLTPLGTKFQFNLNQNFLGTGGSGSSITTTITQPLLQGFGPRITMAPLLQAEYTENVNRLTLKNTIITAITTVIQNYYQLVQSYNNLTIDQLALENSMTLLGQYRIKIQAGQAAPLEIAPLESQVASQRLTITQDKNTIQQNYQALLNVLGLDPNSKLDIDKSLTVTDFRLPDVKRSTDLALENNIPYQQEIYALKDQEIQVMLQKDNQRWQLNLVATKVVTPNAGNGTFINTTNNATGTSTTTSSSGDSVALNLTIPINNKPLQQQLVDAKVALEQGKINLAQQRRTLQSDVVNGLQSLSFQAQQIKQAEDQVNYAQIAYDAEEKKLYYGRTTMINVTNLRANLTQAKLGLISQKINYINTLAAFEATLGITLEKWNIDVYY